MLFDPYNRSEEVNKATLDYLRDGNRADTATCANVLNVIKEADARANVILETAKSIKQDGTAYFMVYEGDGSGTGKETSSGWQNNKKTADYVSEIEQYFNSVDRKGKLITATDPKENLPKAAWELSPENAVRYSKNLDKYDYSKSFSEQIEDYKNGIIPKYDTLVVGKTPEVFTKIGLNPLPMTYGTGHLSDILKGNVQDHDFGEANLKQIPKALESPVAIFASSTRPDSSVVAILDLSYNNKPMFAAVEIDGTGKLNGENIDSNAITTLHTRQNAANMLNKALAKESNGDVSVYYLDKNKAIQCLRSSGVQFPRVMSLVDGYVHSIRDSGSPVNIKIENVTKTQQFKRWFGNWETHPETSSKVVNTDGSPKVVYHGTNADFWTFSLANRGKNGEKLGVGYYFVDNKSSAERYGDRVVEAYLDIKKPASAEVMEISRKDWEKFLDFAIEHRDEYIDGEWKGNDINKEYELTDFDYGSNDAELIKGFLNGIAAGNKDVTEAYLEMLKDSTGYDGIAYNTDNTDYYVAFTPEQIKSATDNIGTFDKGKGDIRYSKQLDIDGKEFVKVDDTTIDEKNPKDIVKALKQIAESKGFYDMEINGQNIGLSNERGVKEWVYSKDAKSLYRSNQAAFNDKMQSFQNANELIEVAKSYINEEAVHKKKFDNFARGEVRFKVGDNGYIADILVGIRRNQSAELYDIVNITPTKITENSGRYVTDSTVQTRQEFSVDSSVPQTNSNVNTDAENSSNSSTDIRYSKELMTAEEKKKVREAERAAYLERQLVSTAPLGGKAKAVSPTAKAAVAKKIASGMPGVSTAQVNEQLTKFDAYNHIKSLTAI